MTRSKSVSENSFALLIVGIGSVAIASAWLLTPRYGPWLCHCVFGFISVAAALYWGKSIRNSRLTIGTCIAGVTVGLALAVASWIGAPLLTQWVPSLAADLKEHYNTLQRQPGPFEALPILLMTASAEELIWRGELVDWLQKRLPIVATIAIGTISYALPIVASKSLLLFGVANCLGLVLTIERVVVGNWLAPLISHVIWAVLVLVLRPIA